MTHTQITVFLLYAQVTSLGLDITGNMNGFAVLDILFRRYYVVDETTVGQIAATPYDFALLFIKILNILVITLFFYKKPQ